MSFKGAQATVEEFMSEWLKMAQMTIRPKTLIQYTQITSTYIIPAIGKLKLKDLKPDKIQALYNSMQAKGIGKRTVTLTHAVLHRALEQALKLGLIGRNPASATTRPRPNKREMQVLNDNQVRAFLSAAKESRYYALFYLAISTGLREGELLGLKWSDLDWASRTIKVQRQIQRIPDKGLIYSEPKTSSSRRTITLGTATNQVLKEHYKYQQLERAAFKGWIENDVIFPSTNGTPTDSRNIIRIFKGILEKAQLPKIRFHDLRHTAATLMLQQNTHPKIVQERLGHSDITMTLNTYSHVLPGMQEEIAEKMDEIMTPIKAEL
jgi:integrase